MTPSGLEAKADLAVSFLKHKMFEYNELIKQIRELARETQEAGMNPAPEGDAPDEAGRSGQAVLYKYLLSNK